MSMTTDRLTIRLGHWHGEIGTIDGIDICREDHGILVLSMGFNLGEGSSHQGLGPLILDEPRSILTGDTRRDAAAFMGQMLLELIDFLGGSLRGAIGRKVIVLRDDSALNSSIRGIATLDGFRTFVFRDWIEQWRRTAGNAVSQGE